MLYGCQVFNNSLIFLCKNTYVDEENFYFSEKDIHKMLNDSNGFAVYEFIQVLRKRFMKLIPLEEEWEKLAIKTGRKTKE